MMYMIWFCLYLETIYLEMIRPDYERIVQVNHSHLCMTSDCSTGAVSWPAHPL